VNNIGAGGGAETGITLGVALVGLELVSTRSYTWYRCKRHSLATRMSYTYIIQRRNSGSPLS